MKMRGNGVGSGRIRERESEQLEREIAMEKEG